MNRMWAPWRKAYLQPKKAGSKGCLFCRLLAARLNKPQYILKRTLHSYAVLNLYPYNNGHVMIVPKRHVDSIQSLNENERLDWLALYCEVENALQRKLRPHGFNAGINMGRAGGAGVPHHLHLHLVPRWKGDVNFMPVVGTTKVISESLKSVYDALSEELRRKNKQKKSR